MYMVSVGLIYDETFIWHKLILICHHPAGQETLGWTSCHVREIGQTKTICAIFTKIRPKTSILSHLTQFDHKQHEEKAEGNLNYYFTQSWNHPTVITCQVLLTLKGDPVLVLEGRAEEGAGMTAFDLAGVTLKQSFNVFNLEGLLWLPLSSLCPSLAGMTFWGQTS